MDIHCDNRLIILAEVCVWHVYMCGWGGGGGMLEMSNVSWAEWKREKKKKKKRRDVYLLQFSSLLLCTNCSFESCFCVGGTFIIF